MPIVSFEAPKPWQSNWLFWHVLAPSNTGVSCVDQAQEGYINLKLDCLGCDHDS